MITINDFDLAGFAKTARAELSADVLAGIKNKDDLAKALAPRFMQLFTEAVKLRFEADFPGICAIACEDADGAYFGLGFLTPADRDRFNAVHCGGVA
jgi:hypothetical protein